MLSTSGRTRLRAVAACAVAACMSAVVLAGPAAASNDPLFAQQYGPQQINAPYAWAKARGAGVTIAVLDTGVDLDHPDLKDKLVPGYNFVDDSPNPDDTQGHGTHVAGTAAAITDNGVGMAGVAPDSRIMPVKVLGDDGSGTTASVALGVRFAADNGAKVINLSLGDGFAKFLGLFQLDELEAAFTYAWNKGALCVVASGNESKSSEENPSGYSRNVNALIVTANDSRGTHAKFANRADTKWAMSAPGVDVLSAVPGGGYDKKSGTSMATPHAAGAAAVLFSQGLSNAEVVDKLLSTARPLDQPAKSGAGLLDLARAVGATVPTAQAATATTVAGRAGTVKPGGAGRGTSGGSTTQGQGGSDVVGAAESEDDSSDVAAGAASSEEGPIALGLPSRRASSESRGLGVGWILLAAAVGGGAATAITVRIMRRRSGARPVRLY